MGDARSPSRPIRRQARRHRTRVSTATLAIAALLIGLSPVGAVAAAAPVDVDARAVADDGPTTPVGYANGRLPREALREAGGVLLAPDAAASLAAMIDAAAADGAVLAVTDGYRSYDQQVDVKRRKGWLAARPGTSQHGWGVAVDFDMRVTDFAWLRNHAATYGWFHPAWAQPGGSKPEPWHWEFAGGHATPPDGHATPPVPPGAPPVPRPPVREEGELIATVRFEPVDAPAGRWFTVREGVAQLERGAGHYPRTAEPGEPGNFAVAGYHRDHRAPLSGSDRLVAGDQIRVRARGGVEHVYRVFERAELTIEDGWAVGPDPLGIGTDEVMTLTTGAGPGELAVVWARRS